MNYQHILVPIDFSEDALHAFHHAVAEFAHPERELVLLHVLEMPDEEGNALSRGRMQGVSRADITAVAEEEGDGLDAARAQCLQRLQALASSQGGPWQQVRTLVAAGEPTEVITNAVTALSSDLVIMGSHGTGGLGRMLFGSTTYAVARKVGCSVMISKRR